MTTSNEAYQKALQSGLIGRVQRTVFMALIEHGPQTSSQITGRGIKGAWKRLSELGRLGVITADAVVKCPVTGMSAKLWRAVPHTEPVAVEKAKSKRDLVIEEQKKTILKLTAESISKDAEIQKLQHDIAQLRRRLEAKSGQPTLNLGY